MNNAKNGMDFFTVISIFFQSLSYQRLARRAVLHKIVHICIIPPHTSYIILLTSARFTALLWRGKPRVVASTATFSGCCHPIISKSTLLWRDKPRVVASTATFSGCCPLTSRYAQGKNIYLFSKKLFPQSKNPFR